MYDFIELTAINKNSRTQETCYVSPFNIVAIYPDFGHRATLVILAGGTELLVIESCNKVYTLITEFATNKRMNAL